MSAAKRKADTRTPVYCQRCGCEIPNATNSQKWCPDCKMAVKAQQSRQSYLRRHLMSHLHAIPEQSIVLHAVPL